MPDANLILVAPKPGSLETTDPNSTLVVMGDSIFDSVLIRAIDGRWNRAYSIASAIRMAKKTQRTPVTLILSGFHLSRLASAFGLLQFGRRIREKIALIRYSRKQALCAYKALREISNTSLVLFDLSEIGKPYMADVLAGLPGVPRISMFHGLYVQGVQEKRIPKPRVAETANDTIALLFSHLEQDFYRSVYQLPESNLKVVGIPRHEGSWLANLTRPSEGQSFRSARGFLLVISRPANDRFPIEQKLAALRDVADVATKNDLDVVVKLHPKETDDFTFISAFGRPGEHLDWSFSNLHPIALGQACTVAVTFYSGVSIDFARLGIPTMERLNLTTNKRFADKWELKDKEGRPVMMYRFLGLTNGANNSEEFHSGVDEILRNRARSVKSTMENYQRVFPIIPGINRWLALLVEATARNGIEVARDLAVPGGDEA